MLQSMRIFLWYPRAIISRQKVVSQSPTGRLPASSMISRTP